MIDPSGQVPSEIQEQTQVTVIAGTAAEAQSMTAEVKIYTRDSRSSSTLDRVGEYSLTLGIVGGVIISRRDETGGRNGQSVARKVVNNGQEVIIWEGGKEVLRRPLQETPKALGSSRKVGPNSLFSRIEFSHLTRGLESGDFELLPGRKLSERRLAAKGRMLDAAGDGVQSFTITMDEELGAIVETVIIKKMSEDEEVIITSSPIIWVEGETPVVVGRVYQEEHKFKSLIPMEEGGVPSIDPDTIPTITMEELKKLETEGAEIRAVPRPSYPGMEAVKDFTLTTMEVYENVVINDQNALLTVKGELLGAGRQGIAGLKE